jgi:uncharacterized protein YcbK (DUF882 family)
MTEPEQGEAAGERLEALETELEQARDERDKAVSARNALVQQMLVPSTARSQSRGGRRGLVAAVLLLLLVAGGLLFYQVIWTNRMLQRAKQPGLGDPAAPRGALHGHSAPRVNPGAARTSRLEPRRVVAIPITGLSLVGRAAVSPDSRLVAVAGLDGKIQIYDLVMDRATRLFRAHQGATRDLLFSADGKRLISGGADGAVYSWPLPRGDRQSLRASGAPVRRLALSGNRLAVAAEQQAVEIIPVVRPDKVQKLEGHTGWVRAVAWSADGHLLASGGHDGAVRLWKAPRGSGPLTAGRVLAKQGQWISALAFGQGGRQLASAGFDSRIRIWRVQDGTLVGQLRGHVRRVTDLALSPGRLASASLDRTARVWQLSTRRQQTLFEGHRYQVNSVAFIGATARPRRTSHLLTASGDGTLRIWPLTAPRPVGSVQLPPPRPGELTLRNNTSGERLRLLLLDAGGGVRAAAARRLSHFLRSGSDDRSTSVDPALVKLLYNIANRFGRQREVVVISGYRSPEFNKLRRKQSRQVGEKSLHIKGKAIDFRIEGVTITALHEHVKRLKAGGVGFYPDSQFIHVDVGPVRTWQGD